MIANSHARRVVDDIVARLKKEYHPEKIILFGSYAYGEPTRDSDIDLFIIKATTESPFQRRLTVRRICHAPDHHIPFQPLVVTPSEWAERLEMGDPFFLEIQDKGETLYAKRERVAASQRLVHESRARYETRGRSSRDQRRRRRRVPLVSVPPRAQLDAAMKQIKEMIAYITQQTPRRKPKRD